MAREINYQKINAWGKKHDGSQLTEKDYPRVVRGYYRGVRSITGSHGDGHIVELEITAREFEVWGCPAKLKPLLDRIENGKPILIAYYGMGETPDGRMAHQFRVYELDALAEKIELPKTAPQD
jgi:hypothetical protein